MTAGSTAPGREADERLAALREQGRDWGEQLRAVAGTVAEAGRGAGPDAVRGLADLPVYTFLARARFGAGPGGPEVHRRGVRTAVTTVTEQVVLFEELARGDVGALLAAPGAPLLGPLVGALGDTVQRSRLLERLDAGPTWTFFALTEPGRGSDAGALTTRLETDPDGVRRLHGAKRFVGNASRADLGVVFARSGTGPLDLRSVLLDAGAPGLRTAPLEMGGLRGALVGEIDLDGAAVAPGDVLGDHLPATRRGMWGWSRVFALLRPRVATMAVGLAASALDLAADRLPRHGPRTAGRLAELGDTVGEVRALVRRAARAVDADPSRPQLAAAAKFTAARLAEDTTLAVAELLGPGSRLDDPVLDRLVRDARCFEFMEGAGNVQRTAVGRHTARRRIHA